LALGKTQRELLESVDSADLAEWWAYNQRWPLGDSWRQTARICRTIMSASGNYKRIPDEDVFIPAATKPNQTVEQMAAELAKLKM
jgi:hypothetical protein